MADSPDRPRNNGRLSLPPVDNAMNKVAPSNLRGGKGSRKDQKPLGQEGGKDKDAEFLAKVRKRMDRCIQAESDNRINALDDLKFKAGDQWPADVMADRNSQKRPCLTINKLPVFIHQITNDLRQNRPSINVSPVGDRGDVEVAKMYRGLIRAIERDSSADIAYDTAADSAVSCGFGYWRILTEYEEPDSFDQVIVIKRIRNPFSVYLDPAHTEPDGADAKYGFISEMISRSEYEDKFPGADPLNFDQSGVGEPSKNWIGKDEIRIAEYFEVSHETRKLVALSNGHVGWEDELSEQIKADITSGKLEVINDREAEKPKITWYKLTAKEVLEKQDWLGKWVPIVKVIGDEVDIEGKVKLSGVVRFAKDPQRMFNYWRTLQTEKVALAPKAKWVMTEGQIEGHETEWKTAHTSTIPVLQYKPDTIAGHPAPPPQRVAPDPLDASVENSVQGAAQDLMATTGVRFDATMNERLMDESGKAIRELRRSGDIGSFHYVDNLSRSLRHTGRILIDLIPKIYDTKRIVTILREDDTEEQVQIDPTNDAPHSETKQAPSRVNPNGKTLKIFNPTYGHYGVTVTIGPSYATKRIEASESMMAFAKALPNTAVLIADLIAKNQDWPGADEMAKRLARALPPNLLAPDMKDVPPQIQAVLTAMDQQIKQLGAERTQLVAALNEKMTDRAIKVDEINKAFEAKVMQVEEKFSEALLKAGAAQEGNAQKLEGDLLKTFMTSVIKASQPEKEPDGDPKPDPIAELGAKHDELAGQVVQLADLIKKPRKVTPHRGKDGMIEHITSEIA